jgi:t-SNARE complex subunit (syntaxin)
MMRSVRGGAAGEAVVILIVVVFFIIVLSVVFGQTFSSLITLVRHFFGLSILLRPEAVT